MRTKMIDMISSYLATQPVKRAWLFGSFARSEERPDSDVDIMVSYDRSQRIGLMKIAGIYLGLKELVGREIDLVEEGTLRSWAEESVNLDKKLIYERVE